MVEFLDPIPSLGPSCLCAREVMWLKPRRKTGKNKIRVGDSDCASREYGNNTASASRGEYSKLSLTLRFPFAPPRLLPYSHPVDILHPGATQSSQFSARASVGDPCASPYLPLWSLKYLPPVPTALAAGVGSILKERGRGTLKARDGGRRQGEPRVTYSV